MKSLTAECSNCHGVYRVGVDGMIIPHMIRSGGVMNSNDDMIPCRGSGMSPRTTSLRRNTTMGKEKEPAQRAYEGYAAFTGGKTFDGRDMPTWENLTERIQNAWRAAIDKVVVGPPQS